MKALTSLAVLGTLAIQVAAQQVVLSKEAYLTPPDPVRSILEHPGMYENQSLANLGPSGDVFLEARSGGMAPLSAYARPYANLGETQIDHNANRSRRLSTGNTVGYDLIDAKSGAATAVEIPEGVTVSGATWSPNGKHIAFLVHEDEASFVWVADVDSGAARQLSDAAVNACLVTSIRWTGDSKAVVAVLVPSERGDMPQKDPVAAEPQVWVSHEGKTPSRTYRFLMKTPFDMELYEWLITGQLAVIQVDGGDIHEVGAPAMISAMSPSPTGKHFRVTTVQKPFSYFVPARSFGSKEEIWDRDGKMLAELSSRPLRDLNGANGKEVRQTKRSLTWRPDGKGLSYLEKEPKKEEKKGDAKKGDAKKGDAKKGDTKKGVAKKAAPKKKVAVKKPDAAKPAPSKDAPKKGDAKKKAGEQKPEVAKQKPKPRMDRLMLWQPPFSDKSSKVVWQSEKDIQSVRYAGDCKTIVVTQTVDKKRRTFAVRLSKPKEELLISETETKAEPEDPMARFMRRRGRGGGGASGLMSRPGPMGGSVVRMSKDGKHVYSSGSDEAEGDKKGVDSSRPYIDRIEIGTGKKERLWQGNGAGWTERLITVADDDVTALYFNRQSNTDCPDAFHYDVASKAEKQLTNNVDPAPVVTAAHRERFQVTRVDGFKFWVRVTIPKNYGNRLPALFWFYPREFTSQKQYDQRTRAPSPNMFPTVRTRSMELLTAHGYVVVQPDCPIVGEEGRMNDNYVGDLRNSLWAVIDELDKRQIIDRDRLAVGGHSYGAFGTANAMVHTPFFKAGIAGDGNYNRTLTPMSFQSERRSIWEAREVYLRMSPLLWAEQFNGALLMYHGADDTNTGTFPIHAPRMFQALNGLGKPTALYMYPYEGHGPAARETLHDLWARWIHWLDIHVKEPGRNNELFQKEEAADITEGK